MDHDGARNEWWSARVECCCCRLIVLKTVVQKSVQGGRVEVFGIESPEGHGWSKFTREATRYSDSSLDHTTTAQSDGKERPHPLHCYTYVFVSFALLRGNAMVVQRKPRRFGSTARINTNGIIAPAVSAALMTS